MIRKLILTAFICLASIVEAALPDLTPAIDTKILDQILQNHAKYHQMNTLLVKRALLLYMEELDPNKTYFIKSDIEKWLTPSEELLNQILNEVNQSNFQAFMEIHSVLLKAIERHNMLEKKIDYNDLPKDVKANEFKNTTWLNNEDELLNRLKRIRALQIETSSKLNEESKDITLKLLAKRQAHFDEEMSPTNPQLDKRLLAYILKAFASSLDPHTIYFTPDEAAQFLIQVQQSLEGIGAELRDEVNGITITRLVQGGPAEKSKELKIGDKIISVNGQPVVGMDLQDVVDLIRGPANTPVTLTILREVPDASGKMHEVKLDATILRGEVILKSTRYASNYIPYGNGGIAYLKLMSFYEDTESSSAADLKNALKKLKAEYNIKGVVLDLRYNSGGLLTQAVAVAGLFIGKGVVVSIKDNKGNVEHLRNLENATEWDGPLLVLENRTTASAAEIVTGTLQDYGRAIVIGNKHTYGKGTYQTFTLNPTQKPVMNPLGEFTVTDGFYYTVSGRTPQLKGVQADIVVPGAISDLPIGEEYSKYPLEPDKISPAFNDDLTDIPADKKEKIEVLYKSGFQPKLTTYETYLPRLIQNSELRIKNDKSYQDYLKNMNENELDAEKVMDAEEMGKTAKEADYQLYETFNIMRDLLYLMLFDKVKENVH